MGVLFGIGDGKKQASNTKKMFLFLYNFVMLLLHQMTWS